MWLGRSRPFPPLREARKGSQLCDPVMYLQRVDHPTQAFVHSVETAHVQTTRGPIAATDIGYTLVHEHVFNKYRPEHKAKVLAHTLSALSTLSTRGINTIVDLTPYTNITAYHDVITQCELNLVACAGFYLPRSIPSSLRSADVNGLTAHLLRKVRNGIGNHKVLPGCLKVAGQHISADALENRLLQAIARVHTETGLPIVTHSPKGALSHSEILTKNGVDPTKILISHLDTHLAADNFDLTLHAMFSLMERGINVLFTEFGSQVPPRPGKKPDLVARLVAAAKARHLLSRVFISSDSNWRYRSGAIRLRHDGPRAELAATISC